MAVAGVRTVHGVAAVTAALEVCPALGLQQAMESMESTTSLEQLVAAYDDTAPVERAWTIPASWYTDPRIAELERRAVWSRTWQLVGRADQVGAPGAFVTAEVAGEPVV